MKIYLLDKNRRMCQAWKNFFTSEEDIEIVNMDFALFMELYSVDCIVSPANAYGLMDGGYDLAITKYAGKALMKRVQGKIINDFYGEQIVGTSIIVDIEGTNKKLIHTPTMRYPEKIIDERIVYQCMRSTLICAMKNNIKSIVIPAFGGFTGGVNENRLAELMYLAYKQIKTAPVSLNWEYAIDWKNI